MIDDRENAPPSHPRILWGRVAFLGATLVLAFSLGAWSAGDDTAGAELEEARAEIERLAEENANLRAEKEALEAGEALDAEATSERNGSGTEADAGDATDEAGAEGEDAPDEGGDAAEEAGAEGENATEEAASAPVDDGNAEAETATDAEDRADAPDAADPGTDTYVVRQGDTGHDIAEAVYGDRDLWPLIADANDLDATALQVDQELVIPPAD